MTSPRALALLALLLCSFATARVHAEEASLRRPERPMAASTQLKLGGAALGGALLGAALTGAVGATTYALADCGACDGEDDDLSRGIGTLAVTSLSGVLLIPGATVLTTRLAGKHLGSPGRLRWLFSGAYIGLGIGVVSTTLLAQGLRDARFLAVLAGGAALTVASVAGITTIFHRVSVRRDLELRPLAAPTAHGFAAGIAGRF